MRLLPIVERELRVTARRHSTLPPLRFRTCERIAGADVRRIKARGRAARGGMNVGCQKAAQECRTPRRCRVLSGVATGRQVVECVGSLRHDLGGRAYRERSAGERGVWLGVLQLWFWVGLAADLGCGLPAWQKVRHRFGQLASRR